MGKHNTTTNSDLFNFDIEFVRKALRHDKVAYLTLFCQLCEEKYRAVRNFIEYRMSGASEYYRDLAWDEFVNKFRYTFIDREKERELVIRRMIENAEIYLGIDANADKRQQALMQFVEAYDIVRFTEKNKELKDEDEGYDIPKQPQSDIYYKVKGIWLNSCGEMPIVVNNEVIKTFMEGMKSIPLRPLDHLFLDENNLDPMQFDRWIMHKLKQSIGHARQKASVESARIIADFQNDEDEDQQSFIETRIANLPNDTTLNDTGWHVRRLSASILCELRRHGKFEEAIVMWNYMKKHMGKEYLTQKQLAEKFYNGIEGTVNSIVDRKFRKIFCKEYCRILKRTSAKTLWIPKTKNH